MLTYDDADWYLVSVWFGNLERQKEIPDPENCHISHHRFLIFLKRRKQTLKKNHLVDQMAVWWIAYRL